MPRWIGKYRTWRRLSRSERATGRLAWFLLPLISLSIKFAGLTATTRWLSRRIEVARRRADGVPADFAASAARLVPLMASYSPVKAVCLAQSVTLWFLLARKGIDSAVRIGVTKESGVFGAHAWVDMNGTVLLDRPDVADRFTVIV
jgi:hypothetical protein